MHKEKRKVLFFSVIGLVISLAGLSYAFFIAKVNGNESESTIYGVAANLTIEFREGTNQVQANDIFPGWSAIKTFYVRNNNSSAGVYSLLLFEVENEFIDGSISYSLVSTNGGAVKDKTDLNLKGEVINEKITIEGGVTQEYTLTVYYNNLDIDQSEEKGKSFSFKVGIDGAITQPAPDGWYTASEGMLLAEMKENYSIPTTPATTPGSGISLQDEAIMASAPDDYGTSYYYRGNVQNNYVVFANMCWRIVRIMGDGSTKLILHNRNDNNLENPCEETGEKLAFVPVNEYADSYGILFNYFSSSKSDNKYLGFMYGSGSTYASAHANVNKSDILIKLEEWYEEKLISYEDKLADVIWCNDKSTTGSGTGMLETYYGGYRRIQGGEPITLICPNDKNGGKLSKFTVNDTVYGNGDLTYKIGLITADEAAYAGFIFLREDNMYTYLSENANHWFWTMTPSYYYEDWLYNRIEFVYLYAINSSGNIGNESSETYSGYLRPCIALSSLVKASSGDGTATSPFIIS